MPSYPKEIIETPLGKLIFTVETSPEISSKLHITAKIIKPTLPDGMSVEKCIAIILEVDEISESQSIKYLCNFEGLASDGGSSSGEGLAAWEWENEHHLVVIGTEDEEYLSRRYCLGQDYLSKINVAIENHYIVVSVKEIKESKKISLHYIVSWNKIPETVVPSCWFAVDQPHEIILKNIS